MPGSEEPIEIVQEPTNEENGNEQEPEAETYIERYEDRVDEALLSIVGKCEDD